MTFRAWKEVSGLCACFLGPKLCFLLPSAAALPLPEVCRSIWAGRARDSPVGLWSPGRGRACAARTPTPSLLCLISNLSRAPFPAPASPVTQLCALIFSPSPQGCRLSKTPAETRAPWCGSLDPICQAPTRQGWSGNCSTPALSLPAHPFP